MASVKAMDAMMQSASKEQQEEGMQAWNDWMEKHKDDFLDQGTPLGRNKRVTKSGAGDERNDVMGYSIVHADSHEAATRIVADSPAFDIEGAYVEVMEMVDM